MEGEGKKQLQALSFGSKSYPFLACCTDFLQVKSQCSRQGRDEAAFFTLAA
jgi:hypothetical protein